MSIPRQYMHTALRLEKKTVLTQILPIAGEDLFLSLWVCGQKILVPTPKEWYLGN